MIINGFFLSVLLAYFWGRSFYKGFLCPLSPVDSICRLHSLFLGLGITSLSFWLYTVVFNGVNTYYPLFELALTIGLLCRERLKCKYDQITNANKVLKDYLLPDLIAIAIICCVTFLCVPFFKSAPNGHWDAIAMWNVKGVFLSDGNYAVWQRMFDDCLDWQHRDYPLFLSATIARSFVFSGTRSSIVPALYALLFTISCFLLVYLYLRKLRQGYFGVIALTILSARSDIVWEGSRQYADLPLMVFILISLFEYTVWVTDKQKSPLPCIVFASFALWTKNEGIVFFILVNLWLYKNYCLGLKRLLGYLAVTIPVLISKYMVVLFANSSNDLMFGASSRLSNFLQAHRYFYLASYVMEFLVQNIWLISIPIILVVDLVDNRFKKVCNLLFIPFFAYLFYFLMYFITPHEIQWHLSTSFRRIIMHYVPALAFLVCLIFSDEKLIKNKNYASYV